ncbi:hypothetical protein REPUB_Repub01dG0165000 [Reevesia pubescens]
MANIGLNEAIIKKHTGHKNTITFDNIMTLNSLAADNWSLLNPWFEDVVRWLENVQVRSRVAWVACFGIPIHAWNIEILQNLSEKWGDSLRMDSVTLEMKLFSKGCMQINTSIQSKIEESFPYKWETKGFNIKAIEVHHDCEFTSPCCYEELNLALRKVGLDGKKLLYGEEYDNGDKGEELGWVELEAPAGLEKEVNEPIDMDRLDNTAKGMCKVVEKLRIELVRSYAHVVEHVVKNAVGDVLKKHIVNKMSLKGKGLRQVQRKRVSNVIGPTENGLEESGRDDGSSNFGPEECEGSVRGEEQMRDLVGPETVLVRYVNSDLVRVNKEELGYNKELGLVGKELRLMVISSRVAQDAICMGLGDFMCKAHENNLVLSKEIESVVAKSECEESDAEGVEKGKRGRKWRWLKNVEE